MYNTIKLEKSLYSITGKSFTQALSGLDSDENYINTPLSGLDAYERQLKRYDISVRGNNSDRVEKFFISAESAVLFPEFVRRSIKQGMDEASILSEITAAVTYTDSMDYRGLTVTKNGADSAISEGTALPETTVRLSSSATSLSKFARKLSCSYESIRKQRLEAFGVILKNLGAQISRAVNAAAISSLSNGLTTSEIAGSAVAYSDLAKFWASMSNYNMTSMVVKPETMAAILALDEMKYCIGDYMTGGAVKTPYGVTLVKSTGISSDIAIGVDKSCALEAVFGTDIVVDFDKLISTQCDEISCSITVGFSKLTDDAVKVMKTVKTA